MHEERRSCVVLEPEVNPGIVNRCIEADRASILFVIRDAVSMLMALDDWQTSPERRTEHGGRNLTDPTTNPRDCGIALDGQSLKVTVLGRDRAQALQKREDRTWLDQRVMQFPGSHLDVIGALGRRTGVFGRTHADKILDTHGCKA